MCSIYNLFCLLPCCKCSSKTYIRLAVPDPILLASSCCLWYSRERRLRQDSLGVYCNLYIGRRRLLRHCAALYVIALCQSVSFLIRFPKRNHRTRSVVHFSQYVPSNEKVFCSLSPLCRRLKKSKINAWIVRVRVVSGSRSLFIPSEPKNVPPSLATFYSTQWKRSEGMHRLPAAVPATTAVRRGRRSHLLLKVCLQLALPYGESFKTGYLGHLNWRSMVYRDNRITCDGGTGQL